MSRHTHLFEPYKIIYRTNGVYKTALVNVRDHERAEKIAVNYPGVISITKIKDYEVLGFPVNRIKDAIKTEISVAIKMDEMIWLKRNGRRENEKRDKWK